MKSAILGVLFVGCSLPAAAADALLAQPANEAAPTGQAVNWTGAYGGVLGGVAFLRGSFVTNSHDHSTTMSERFVGAFAGYQYQLPNNIVLGVEGNANYGLEKTQYDGFGSGSEMWTDWSGTIRARVGYAFDRTLVYATGGWAAQRSWVDSTVTGKESDIQTGYVVGAGVEYALTSSLFGRFEYQFADYLKKQSSVYTNADLSSHTFMVGVGTRF